ncbi:MAG: aspartyl-tRNA(Asn)/glutamyl-tRNA(Gln) amidotransferase subunit B [Oceanicoccus sp.]|jgi:aspartyl-tRNA(Asn)/glutamyl-tRNA(Gln) amidotransferase subunit B
MTTEYEVIIGLEIHAQIDTKSKFFSPASNDSFGKEPNTNVSAICMGMPGTLPVPSREAIEKGAKAALALGCELAKYSKFDRKNYFYPDLPYGYQISQFDEPISNNGVVDILINGEKKKIGITRLHLECDAGKLVHTGKDTLLDFNRAGAPLMEIVTDPDLRSAEEARVLAESVQKILRYVGSSKCDMEKGMMRFDASVSLRPMGEDKLYPRAEIKNLNSFRSLEMAINYEIKRQTKLWNAGTPSTEEKTVGWDDDRGTTVVMRTKESAADYRYFPEPDIPPIVLTDEQIEGWKKEVPELPLAKFERFMEEFGLKEIEATFYTESRDLADLFEHTAKDSGNAKAANSFVGTILVKQLKDAGLSIADSPVSKDHLVELIKLVEKGTISNSVAKSTVFDEMMKTGTMPAVIVEEEGLAQVSDTGAIEEMCKKAIEANPSAIEDIKGGKMKAMGSLVGYVMKESKGQANPGMVNDILKKLLL